MSLLGSDKKSIIEKLPLAGGLVTLLKQKIAAYRQGREEYDLAKFFGGVVPRSQSDRHIARCAKRRREWAVEEVRRNLAGDEARAQRLIKAADTAAGFDKAAKALDALREQKQLLAQCEEELENPTG